MAVNKREARVSRDSDGNVLGVALFVGADALPDDVVNQERDRIAYTVNEGQVVLQV